MKKVYNTLIIAVLLITGSACQDYLDVVPDNVATIEHAFSNRNEAEKFLFTCYSYLPKEGDPDANPAFNGGDEVWTYWPMVEDFFSLDSYNIARGLQNKVDPEVNYWDGFSDINLWQGIRNCNLFLDNIDQVKDIQPYEKDRWVAEVKFLKAYFHWYLFRMYGPIPLMDEALPATATPETINAPRQPADSVVNYIAGLIDESLEGEGDSGLPLKILNEGTELGRITKVAALAIKARLLVTAASPLFNGNPDYANFMNKDGTPLFASEYSEEKWHRAADACKEAIDAAHEAGKVLYTFNPSVGSYDEHIMTEMSIRNAVAEKWNSELLWGTTHDGQPTYWLQVFAAPQLDPNNFNLTLKGKFAPTLKMAELFYTENGVPINEDKTWDYQNRYELQNTTADDYGMQADYKTVGLHFDREPRFYASIAFDGSTWFMQNGTYNINSKLGQHSAKKQSRLYSVTGYYTKKLVNWNLVATTSFVNVESYPWPIMRLSDLYLLYAEALNEIGNSAEALIYINQIRDRAGLNSVESSWGNYSTQPGKYQTKEGLRAIIQQERGIEMAFEGSRFWDLRRWKTAPQVLNSPIYGWDIEQEEYEEYNQRVFLFNQKFVSPRDYFWPIREYNLQINPNLVQNPGW